VTVRRAERITGMDIRIVSTGFSESAYRFQAEMYFPEDPTVVLVSGYGGNAEEAVCEAVRINYNRNRSICFRDQDFRCAICGNITGLECHHIVSRARGRYDGRENLLGVCPYDHVKVTDGVIKVIEIDSRVLKSVAKHGWQWTGPKGWGRIAA